jgi:hypothetical protein
MRRPLLLVAALVLMLFSGTANANATTSSGTFHWEAGAADVCNVEPTACPDVARASNGDTLTLRAQGDMNATTGAASGGGTFEHRNSAGTLFASGNLTATRLVAFSFYGCGGGGFPDFLCGGRAAFAVHIVAHPATDPSATIERDGILQVTCLIGSPPSGAEEGFRLNVKDVINFNKSVGGDTVFIQTS